MREFLLEWMHLENDAGEGGYAGKLTRGALDELKDWIRNGSAPA